MWRHLLVIFIFLGLSGAALAAPTTSTADFTDNGDGTVIHNTTGLTWKRCAEGQTWSGSACAGTATGYTWAQATALTATFAGNSDWRLPTIRELFTIAELDAYDPAINSTIFPNTSASYFWSASAYAGDSVYAWDVNFGYGFGYGSYKTLNYYVRLVRGGQSFGLLASNRPTTDYVDHGDGTVTHTPTSLTWKRCAEGQTWNGSTCTGTAANHTWAQATAFSQTYAGSSDWRLPTQTELRSLLDFTQTDPAINRTIFPNTPASYFWSASAYAGHSDYAWLVDFGSGLDYYFLNKSNFYYIRLVRGGQSVGSSSPAISLNGLSLSCPTTLNVGAIGSCSTIANYSDASNKSVSASWSSSNPTTLSINSSGMLTAKIVTADTPVTVTASYSEGGTTKTASATVIVKAVVPVLCYFSLSPASAQIAASGGSGDFMYNSSCSNPQIQQQASSSDSWIHLSTVCTTSPCPSVSYTVDANTSTSSRTGTITIGGLTFTIIQAASANVTEVKLTGLTASCPFTINTGATATCSATATYSNNTSNTVTATWASSNTSTATISGNTVTGGNITVDTPVSITVSYTENGVTQTATAIVNVKAAVSTACSGIGSNLSSITIVGNAMKKLGGDSLEVDYCLKNFNTATNMDVYVAVQLPDSSLLFMQAAGFFSMPTFTSKTVPYLTNTLIPDKSGPVLVMPAIPMGLPTGTYTFYAIPVLAGKDLMNFTNWVGNLAKGQVTLSQ